MAIFTMCESTEQRICIKFCFKIWKTATETYRLLQQAYGEDARGRTQVSGWFRRFTKRVEPPLKATPARDSHQHRETRTLLLKFETIVRNNRRMTVREIADDCGISVGSCHEILN